MISHHKIFTDTCQKIGINLQVASIQTLFIEMASAYMDSPWTLVKDQRKPLLDKTTLLEVQPPEPLGLTPQVVKTAMEVQPELSLCKPEPSKFPRPDVELSSLSSDRDEASSNAAQNVILTTEVLPEVDIPDKTPANRSTQEPYHAKEITAPHSCYEAQVPLPKLHSKLGADHVQRRSSSAPGTTAYREGLTIASRILIHQDRPRQLPQHPVDSFLVVSENRARVFSDPSKSTTELIGDVVRKNSTATKLPSNEVFWASVQEPTAENPTRASTNAKQLLPDEPHGAKQLTDKPSMQLLVAEQPSDQSTDISYTPILTEKQQAMVSYRTKPLLPENLLPANQSPAKPTVLATPGPDAPPETKSLATSLLREGFHAASRILIQHDQRRRLPS